MARKKRLSADEITAVWTAPEQLRVTRLQQAVEDGASAQEVADLAAQTGHGEYREYLGDEEVNGRVQAKLGGLLVWVHPESAAEGWYEVYDGDDADYVPVVREAE